MTLELLHALWLVAAPVGWYLYRDLKQCTAGLSHRVGKHGRKLARHKENLAGLAETLGEVKEGVGKLNDKLDAVIAKKG